MQKKNFSISRYIDFRIVSLVLIALLLIAGGITITTTRNPGHATAYHYGQYLLSAGGATTILGFLALRYFGRGVKPPTVNSNRWKAYIKNTMPEASRPAISTLLAGLLSTLMGYLITLLVV